MLYMINVYTSILHAVDILFLEADDLRVGPLVSPLEGGGGVGEADLNRFGLSSGGGLGGSAAIFLIDLGVAEYCSWYFSQTS